MSGVRSMALVSLLLSACGSGKSTSEDYYAYPELDLSTSRLDFESVDWGEGRSRTLVINNLGDLPMGIDSIALREDEMEDNFTVSYDASTIECPTSSAARVAEDTAAPADTAASASSDDVIVLDPGCKLGVNITLSPTTVGAIYSSLEIHTVNEDVSRGSPGYYKDPDNQQRVVILEGEGVKGGGNLIVTPLNLDFGKVYLGQSQTEFISVYNVGDGDLTLGAPALGSDCSTSWVIDAAFEEGRILAGDSSALIQVTFTPSDDEASACTLAFTSDDTDEAVVEVNLQGNVGSDPENHVPTAALRAPEVGYVHTDPHTLEVEINVFDADQDASSLVCKVKSAVLLNANIATCTPSDASGHMTLEIDNADLEVGVDTLLVTVTDGNEAQAQASTTILYQVGFPESDDDSDGFGDDPSEANVDCDDDDTTVYPYAAEQYDGKDNDCDGTVDEGTEGYDDDGDTVSEADGDCNDDNSKTYPGGPETGDHEDNDCDGIVDEGTALYDDDGDGFSETENDCDDDVADVSPASSEYCDGIDNDCNGLKDEQDGCIALDTDPIIIGGIQMGVTALGVNESTTMTVFAFDPDGQDMSYSWQQDTKLTSAGYNAVDNPIATNITFTAPPSLGDGSQGEIYSMFVAVIDEDGNQAWAFGDITVYPSPVDLGYTVSTSSGGCSDSGSEALFLPLLPALAALGLARRRQRG